MKITLSIVALIISIIALNVAFSNRDAKIMKAADLYEECVRQEYGVSPSYWYQEHGEYPTCPKN